jgi:hypothetical protein
MSDEVKNALQLQIGLIKEVMSEGIFIKMDQPLENSSAGPQFHSCVEMRHFTVSPYISDRVLCELLFAQPMFPKGHKQFQRMKPGESRFVGDRVTPPSRTAKLIRCQRTKFKCQRCSFSHEKSDCTRSYETAGVQFFNPGLGAFFLDRLALSIF